VNRVILIAALLLALPMHAAAQSAAPSPGLFEVEIVVFQNNLTYLEGEELWTSDTVDTELPGMAEAADLPDQPNPTSVLTRAALTLKADANYRVLAHKRWLLSAEPRSAAKRLYFRGISTAETELEGVLKFYQGRFLHVELDLLLRQFATGKVASTDPNQPKIQIYRIGERRRIRSHDVNYFDHPKFGALVQVAPVE
jgi:hypothetical protein